MAENVAKFVFNQEGLREFLKGGKVEKILLKLGEDIARDAATINPNGEYSVSTHRSRKWRNVIIVKDTSKGAIGREAAKGYLARVARKKRS
jgi:hypothetical protein